MAIYLTFPLLRRPVVALASNSGYGGTNSLNLQFNRRAHCACHLQDGGSQEPAAAVLQAGGGASGPPRRPGVSHGGQGGRREPFRPDGQEPSSWSRFLELAAPRIPVCIGMVAIGLGLHSIGRGISSTGVRLGAGVTKAGASLVTAGTQLGSDLATKTFPLENKSQGLARATSVLGEKAMKKGVEIIAIWAVCMLGLKLMDVFGSGWKPPPPPV
ncbi:hypothetical protein Vretimale_19054 [Volvox reticuliferus]|uniref:Uncharacterized protein n=1 Tax=Volvox reticuliferus TaxID=1737510 RepID=A0A8J4FQ93_9CHLO|nr:hypothetical protein Vretifemale_13133 [Volvox reticuliferus]GIM16389.1 hypothetical protein Vretimale_19054 [Volvox reticuliferus]